MTCNRQRLLLWGYLLIALGSAALYRGYGRRFLTLLPASDAALHSFSLSLLPGMAAFLLLFALSVFFSAPTTPLFCLAAGYLYGAVPGTAGAVLATTLGAGAAFLFFRRTIVPPPPYSRVEVGNLFFVLVLLRCSPWFPGPLINLFCGTNRVRPSFFVASTLLGSLPLVSVYTLTASRLRGPLEVSLLRSPEIVTALSVLGAISLISCLRPARVVAKHLRALAGPFPGLAGRK